MFRLKNVTAKVTFIASTYVHIVFYKNQFLESFRNLENSKVYPRAIVK